MFSVPFQAEFCSVLGRATYKQIEEDIFMVDASTLPFHRKYRPSKLADYIGNEKLKRAALAALRGDARPQVILLSGASGCGKTTFARLLAKEYLCEHRDDVTGACDACPSCQELDDYIKTGDTDFLTHVKEIDITDQSGKKDLDAVLEEVMIPSFGDQWDVYIFDECHMATKAAQNRFLKIAEEPPEHKLMIFCTTNPEAMLETLKNRCQLNLRVTKPKVDELTPLLGKVCQAEGMAWDNKGLRFIAQRSGLTIRESLQLLWRVATEKNSAKYDDVVDVLEEVGNKLIVDFYKKLLGSVKYDKSGSVVRDSFGNAVRTRDILGYVTLLHTIRTKFELPLFIQNLYDFTVRGIYIVNQVMVDGVAETEMKTYRDLFGEFSVDQMVHLITVLLDMKESKDDLEAKLLLLGYRGLDVKGIQEETSGVGVSAENKADLLSNLGVSPLAGELALEKKQEDANREKEKMVRKAEGELEAESLIQSSSLSAVQSLFGGVMVDP